MATASDLNTAGIDRLWVWGAVTAWLAIALTPLGTWLEATLITHVLVEIPALVAIGIIVGIRIQPHVEGVLHRYNRGGIVGLLTVTFTLVFWMIPRWLDAALTDTPTALAKYISLVLLAGAPLAWSWRRMHFITRGLVKIELLSMLFRLGWLYLISPQRLCNSYLLDDQIWLGRGLLCLGAALSVTWLTQVLFGPGLWQIRSPTQTRTSSGGG